MGSKRRDAPEEPIPSDFGWLLHGRPVEHCWLTGPSISPAAEADGAFLKPYCLDVATLQSCLQCGACTATCDLAGDEGLFPRRQVTFVRLGLQDRLAADQEIWHCYGCTECSAKCPSGCQAGEHHERAPAVRHGPLRLPAVACPHRQQQAALLGRVPGHGGVFSP